MKLKKTALALSVLVAAGSAAAEFSANIGQPATTSGAASRRPAKTPPSPGGLDYAHDSGFYAGTWRPTSPVARRSICTRASVARISSLGDDVGVIYYAYPSFNDADFTEIYGCSPLVR